MKLVTREELNSCVLNDYDPYTKTVASLIGIAQRLLAERDAFREVAKDLLWSDEINHPICKQNTHKGEGYCGDECKELTVAASALTILSNKKESGK